MACGATLKRTMDFDPLMSPTSPKRRRCVPVSTSSPSPRKYLRMEPSPFGEFSSTISAGKMLLMSQIRPALVTAISNMLSHCKGEMRAKVDPQSKFSFVPPEQILQSIKQEYKRIQKRKHLDGGYLQSDCSYSPESPSQSSRASSGGVSPTRKEQPLFTLRQVGIICERLLKEREEKVREEYEETMTSKLAEQYDTFVKFTHDQLMRRFGEQPASYVS
ncbi:akirin-2-like isoform X1 [Takifugu rubripes]|uniref:akirin-2-like isoform X1 n=1 Tax=Takifugu rubripes TaxID=31033 RepID=UPI001145745D|nr:akirin-2-like isoform X1 [Takifugu rubripes]XP_056915126.1 akirin-2-like isoform X2 [Takifugu flavidus]